MESDYQHILEKQKKRFEVLKAIYTDTNGEENKASLASEISDTTGIPTSELAHILRYLQQEGLIRPLVLINDCSGRIPILILHQGVVEIESAMSKPHEPTEHFPAQIFNITNHGLVANQQFGNSNTANVTQNVGSDVAEVLQIIDTLRQSVDNLPSANQPIAIEALEDIKEEVVAPTRASRVRGALLTLWSVGKDVASFANATTSLAQRFGMDNLLP